MNSKKKLILASSSSARQTLISTSLLPLLSPSNFLGAPIVHLIPSTYDELVGREDGSMNPQEYVLYTAKRKAKEVLEDQVKKAGENQMEDIVVVAADTIMILVDPRESTTKELECKKSQVIGKQKTRKDAKQCLRMLSGTIHKCLTAQVILQASRCLNQPEFDCDAQIFETLIEFMPLTEDLIETYLDTNEWEGKAGAYAIQGIGASLVKEIKGNLTAVIGLNIPQLLKSISKSPFNFKLKATRD